MAYPDAMLYSNSDKSHKSTDDINNGYSIHNMLRKLLAGIYRGVARLFAPKVSNHNGCP
jgi:hypothetical protein